MVLRHLTHAAYAPVSEVIDVVYGAVAVLDVDERLENGHDIGAFVGSGDECLRRGVVASREVLVVVEGSRTGLASETHAAIELHPPHRGEVVAFRVEEEIVKEAIGRILRGRLAGAHHPVDFDLRSALVVSGVVSGIDAQGGGDVRTAVDVVDIERVYRFDTVLPQHDEKLLVQLVIRAGELLSGLFVNDIVGEDSPVCVLVDDLERVDAGPLHAPDVPVGDAPARFHQALAFLVLDVERCDIAAQAIGVELEAQPFLNDSEGVGLEKEPQDVLGGVAERTQQYGGRQFAPPVDAHVNRVLGIELEVEPRAAVRNDAGREEQLPRRVGLAPVVLEEHAGRAMQLRDDYSFGPVHDEGAGIRHERNLAHVHFLLLDVPHRTGAARALVVEHETQLDAQGRSVSIAAQLALLDVENRGAEPVAHVLEPRVSRVALDREHRLEGRVQSLQFALLGSVLGLQELVVRIDLNREQIGRIQHAPSLAEVFSHSLAFSEGI